MEFRFLLLCSGVFFANKLRIFGSSEAVNPQFNPASDERSTAELEVVPASHEANQMVWASRPAIPIFAARNAPEFALRDYGSLARSWGAGENFRQADFSVSIKKEEAAPEVKADSLYVRLVIAKHSLERVLETGLRMRLWRKTAATGAT